VKEKNCNDLTKDDNVSWDNEVQEIFSLSLFCS